MSRDRAVEAEGLERVFKGGIRAVDGVDLAVERGEVFGFLGPNGAGKSTTVRMLTTLLRPTGRAGVAWPATTWSATRRRCAAASASRCRTPRSTRYMTGRELLHLQAVLHGFDRGRGRAPGRRAARARRPRRRRRPARRHLLGRHAAPARPRARARARARGALPRRADHRPRPDLPPDALGRGAPAERRVGHDRLPHDPVPRGGRPARRARRDHRRRPDRRRGHARPR